MSLYRESCGALRKRVLYIIYTKKNIVKEQKGDRIMKNAVIAMVFGGGAE